MSEDSDKMKTISPPSASDRRVSLGAQSRLHHRRKYLTFADAVTLEQAEDELVEETLIPFTISPLIQKSYIVSGDDSSEVGKKASFIELFYDLFFVASLLTFTLQHTIVSPLSVVTYVGFFTIIWWVWSSQSLYDVRFETRDVVHRIYKLFQLSVLAFLASYSARFDIFISLPIDSLTVDSHAGTDLTLLPSELTEDGLNAFRGIFMTLFVSRIILASQYLLALYHTWHSPLQSALHLGCLIGLYALSAAMFLIGYFIVSIDLQGAQIAKVCLMYFAIFFEAFSMLALAVVFRNKEIGFSMTYLPERWATLTLMIVGEGVIGLLNHLQKVMAGFGFGRNSIIAIIMSVLIVYLVLFIYFDFQQESIRFSNKASYCWALLHYPLHVAILILIEGMNGVMLYMNMGTAVDSLNNSDNLFNVLHKYYNYKRGENLTITAYDITITFDPRLNGTDLSAEDAALFNLSFLARILQSYSIGVPDSFETMATQVIDGTIALKTPSDVDNFLEHASESLDEHFEFSSFYLLGAAAGYLLFSAILILIQRYPQNKFAWFGVYARISVLVVFIIIGCLAAINQQIWLNYISYNWELPSIAIAFAIVVAMDIGGMFFMRRAVKVYAD